MFNNKSWFIKVFFTLIRHLTSFYTKRGEKVFINTPETFYVKKASYLTVLK